jgi:hypothetical protein
MKRWELWDKDSRNILGVFNTSKDAFDAVLLVENDEGTKIARQLALGVQSNGHPELIAEGEELLKQAHQSRKPAREDKPQPERAKPKSASSASLARH